MSLHALICLMSNSLKSFCIIPTMHGIDRVGGLERRMNHINGEADEDLQQE